MSRRNLLVLRAGDRSLHPGWLAMEGEGRNWDLHISYFGNRSDPFGALPDGVGLSIEKGPKYVGLADCFDHNPHFLEHYDFIGCPDDDLEVAAGSWSEVFEIAEESGAAIAQPSLDARSYISHAVTIQRRRYRYRRTSFVEVMCPIFTRDALKDFLPRFRDNQSSWGLDYLWSSQIENSGQRLAVIDAAAMLHTRAVLKGTQYRGNGTDLSPFRERDEMLRKHGLEVVRSFTLEGVLPDGRVERHAWRLNRRCVAPRIYRMMKLVMGLNVIGL
jgi:hypothetical protein